MDIKTLRKEANMSQSQFAKTLDIPLKTIQSWENNTRKPPDYVIKLAEKALIAENYIKVKTPDFKNLSTETLIEAYKEIDDKSSTAENEITVLTTIHNIAKHKSDDQIKLYIKKELQKRNVNIKEV